MARHVHEADVRIADKLYLGSIKQAVVVFAYKARILNRLLREFPNVGLCAYDAHVVWVGARPLICECNVLADEHPDANARHVEAVKEGLDVVIDLHPLPFPLPFQDTLRNRGHNAVVPPFDLLQRVCELCVVCAKLRGPVSSVVCCGVVSPARCCAFAFPTCSVAIAVAICAWRRPVLSLLDAGVLCGLGYQALVLTIPLRRPQ